MGKSCPWNGLDMFFKREIRVQSNAEVLNSFIWDDCTTIKRFIVRFNRRSLCFLGPRTSISVLSEFKSRTFAAIHFLMSETQASSEGKFGASPCFIEMYSCVSSAYQWKLTFQMTSPRGKIYNENNSGPKTEPWGTLTFSADLSEDKPFTETNWYLSDRPELVGQNQSV